MDALALIGTFLVGSLLGRLINVAAETIGAASQTSGSPARRSMLPCTRPWHRAPIIGWALRAKEASSDTKGAWLRPLLVELFTAAGLSLLYWWEVQRAMLLPSLPLRLLLFQGLDLPRGVWLNADAFWLLHSQFLAHAVLIVLMLAASLIDIDEMIIPDEITVPGTLAALLLAATYPWSLPPALTVAGQGGGVAFLTLTFPNRWPEMLDGAPQIWSLLIALTCYAAWCVALLPWLWRPGLGWARAARMLLAYIGRRVSPAMWIGLPVIGAAVIALTWWRGGAHWTGLLTALVGMAFGGGLVWIVRFLGGTILGREAMGFGDVTLMAMIGAVLGWQAALIVFFLAPLAALGIGVVQWIVYRDNVIPYGPYLCVAAVAIVVGWASWWTWIAPIMLYGALVPLALLVCIPLLALMLGVVRVVKMLFAPTNAS